MSNDLLLRLTDLDLNGTDPVMNSVATDSSAKIAAVYADMLTRGASDEAVARAMMGATLSLYDALGMGDILPAVLRILAERLEQGRGRAH